MGFLDRIREYKPTAMAYLAEDTLNLMSDAPHDLVTGKKRPENVVTYVHMGAFDGGDWWFKLNFRSGKWINILCVYAEKFF